MGGSDYRTMKEIGRLFGATSHAIGRKLKEVGLRTAEGKPGRRAFEGGLCDRRRAADGEHYCRAWHEGKTVRALEQAGLGQTGHGQG
jgi:hypothetical protein